MLRDRVSKTLIAVTMLAALLTASPSGLALEPGGTFVDDNGSVHEASIEAVFDAGITVGCNGPVFDRFCPSRYVTRAQMATFLVRALDLPPGEWDFTDIAGNTHEENIKSLAAAGITVGCNGPVFDQFCPSRYVTRGQMATFLVRAFNIPPGERDFVDIEGNTHAANIESLAAAGITVGCNGPVFDQFCPWEYVTRAQMATFLARAIPLTPIPAPPPLPADNPNDLVTIGTQNWLYYEPTYDQACDVSAGDVARLVAEIGKAKSVVTLSGRDFVYAIPPNKVVVYPDTAPGFAGSCADTNSQLLQAGLTAAADPNRVDLLEPFTTASEQIYWKHDTHWNNDGALRGSELIAAAAAPGVWDQLGLESTPASRQGDLATLIGVSWVEEYQDQTPTLAGVSPTISEETARISGRPLVSYSSPVRPELADARTAIIHDSFGMFFRNKLGPLFENATFVPTFSHPIPDDALSFVTDAEQIVLEVVERNVLRDFLGAGLAGTLAAALADDFTQTAVAHTRNGESVSFTIPSGGPGDLRYLIVELDTSALTGSIFIGDAADLSGEPWADEIAPDATRYGFEVNVDSGPMELPLPSSLTVTDAYVIVVE